MGVHGCPRFDHAAYWNRAANCDWKCVEGTCYNDIIGDCILSDHQTGVKKMIEARRAAHIYHALKSLLEPIRQETMDILARDLFSRRFLPRIWSSDYRTYHGENIKILLSKIGEHQNWDFAQNFIEKASKLTFSDIVLAPITKEIPKYKQLFDQFNEKYSVKRRRFYHQ
jgi:hypothetical protein